MASLNLIISIAIATVLTLSNAQLGARSWQDGNDGNVTYATSCDFVGKDLSAADVEDFECGGQCLVTPDCTHFAWSEGRCRMKQGPVSLEEAVYSSLFSNCGVVKTALATTTTAQPPGAPSWQDGNNGAVTYATSCDFVGKDLSAADVEDFECGGQCLVTPDCTHFAWSEGRCRMKQGPVSLEEAVYSSLFSNCGVVKTALAMTTTAAS